MNDMSKPTPPAPAASSGPGLEPGVVASHVYLGGKRIAEVAIDEAGVWARKPGHVVWIGLHEPSDALLARVGTQFALHDLALEDAGKRHQRPKIEQYGDSLFIIARTAQMLEGRVEFGETHLFVGRGYVVSIRHGASATYRTVRERCEACPTTLSHGEDYILYAILDFIVDNYAPVLEAVQEEVETIEDTVLASRLAKADVERLYLLRRDLLRLRMAASPLVEVCRRLEHAEAMAIDPAMQPLFRDVADHITRVQDEIAALREVLAFAFEASLLTGQAQANETMRQLAAWAAILAVPTAIAGIYGMNFEDMPELKVAWAYPALLGVIASVCGMLFWRFRRKGWL
ncbi:magnesium and cobalt transport protein CorA [Humitalea sp. 24SJ18S-53]|uniref:magnesium and cobalt transport protein CorA n=1 Tax=Humitalea sp. 24SJ18S-53 TaxID=3422307 RepID=UPI003D67F4E7